MICLVSSRGKGKEGKGRIIICPKLREKKQRMVRSKNNIDPWCRRGGEKKKTGGKKEGKLSKSLQPGKKKGISELFFVHGSCKGGEGGGKGGGGCYLDHGKVTGRGEGKEKTLAL